MKIILLGSGGYYPNDQRHTACIWIPEYQIVLDAGTGAYRLNHHQPTPPSFDVFLTHAHLDHVAGLTFLLPILLTPRPPVMRLHATELTLAAVRDHLFAPAIFPVEPPLVLCPLGRTTRLAAGIVVTSFPLAHPGGCTGLRLDFPSGKSLAYVTDTSANPGADYVREIQQVDLLIHECNFADSQHDLAQLTGHSTLSNVLAVAKAVGCARLVLVHLDPYQTPAADFQVAARTSGGAIQIGHDLLEIDL